MPAIRRRDTSAWIKTVAASYGKRVGSIAYIFCNDDKILEVNRQYLQHDYYTDIITFDYCDDERMMGKKDTISGDLFISNRGEVDRILGHFPEAKAVDMESAAIAQVCAAFGVPFFGMRVISDSPWASHDNSRQYDDFWEDAPRHSFKLVQKLLTSL